MPLTPPKRQKISDTENKLRLLCCISVLGSVTEAQLWPFVASLELMEYIPMQLLLHELIADGDVETGAHALRDQLFITKQGEKSMQLFADRIMPSDRERILAAAPTYRAQILQHSQVRAVYELAQPGQYRVLLSLQEGELPTLSLRLSTTRREVASRAVERFPRQASTILTHLYGMDVHTPSLILTDKTEKAEGSKEKCIDDSAPSLAVPTLTQHSAHEVTVTAPLPGQQDNESLILSLLLPGLSQAEAYQKALSQSATAAACAAQILTLLIGEDTKDATTI